MRLYTYLSYFSRLRALIGLRAAITFSLIHAKNKMFPPRGGAPAHASVGPYVFYFPSLLYFEGLFTEIFFNETYYLDQTQEPIRVIDCGANIGMSLLYIKTRAPKAQVLCFEPNPAARAVLEKNVEANGWQKEVQVLPSALGKSKGTVEFFVDDKDATSSGGGTAPYKKNRGRELRSYQVEIDTLSKHITDHVDLLKIDIEGNEFDVLEELAGSGALQRVAAIQLEYHYIPGFFTRPLSEMLSLLESAGFHTFVHSNASAHQVIGRDTLHTYMVFAWRR